MTETIQRRSIAATITTRDDSAQGGYDFTGIAVPFDEEYRIPGWLRERFDPACVFEGLDRAKVYYQHRDAIGRIAASRTTDAGLEIDGVISHTARGDEAATLLRDGVIDSLSIGFEPVEWRTERDEDEDIELTVYTRVRVREVSLVSFPAYEQALITETRSDDTHHQEEPTMPTATAPTPAITRDDLDGLGTELRALVEDENRKIAQQLGRMESRDGAPIGSQWRSGGEFLKDLARGDESAAAFYREYQGTVVADGKPQAQWIADRIKLVEQRRRIKNMFSTESLPDKGLSVEYYKLDSDTSNVAKQGKEGDKLAFGKVSLTTATATLDTYGGYTSLSRQAIDRSTAPLLSTAQTAQALAYARATEAAVRSYVYSEVAAQVAAGNKLSAAATVAALKNADWLDLIVDSSETFEDRGFTLTQLLVSKDVFKTLYRLEDTAGHNLMNVYGTGTNVSGDLDLRGISGNLANVPVALAPGAQPGTAVFVDPVAITTWESAGAPLQLQDENILELTKDYSVYGYLATGTPFPEALLPVEFKTD
ncbi:MAG: HK97 family phage prohead protease [Pseudoclavibacter sp.]